MPRGVRSDSGISVIYVYTLLHYIPTHNYCRIQLTVVQCSILYYTLYNIHDNPMACTLYQPRLLPNSNFDVSVYRNIKSNNDRS
jgi:hypothetical protein